MSNEQNTGEGGSYIRNEDGSLTLISRTEEAKPAPATVAAEKPATSKKKEN